MNQALAICLLVITAGTAASQNPIGKQTDRARLAGAWRLAWLEQPGPDGTPHRVNGAGLFVFTPDGHAGVQVMERTQGTQSSGTPKQYSQGGYEASWGTYKVDERAHTFTFHIEGALVRTLVGQDLPRAYEFSGSLLIVKSTRTDEHWRVAWERYQGNGQ